MSKSDSAASPFSHPLALHHACWYGDAATLRSLLADEGRAEREFDVNSVDGYGCTALHIAVMRGETECAEVLLQHGAKVDIKNRLGFTAIHEAASLGDRSLLSLLWTSFKRSTHSSPVLHDFLDHLQSIPNFDATLAWKLQSWIPFITRFLPDGAIRIGKAGKKIRIDTQMLELKGMRWIKHPFSFIIRPNDEESRQVLQQNRAASLGSSEKANEILNTAAGLSSSSSTTPVSTAPSSSDFAAPLLVVTLDHDRQKWQLVKFDDGKKDEKQTAESVPLNSNGPSVDVAPPPSSSTSTSTVNHASSDNSSSASSSSSSPSDSTTDVDLAYELDDFQSYPILSAFLTSSFRFLPVTRRSLFSIQGWKQMLGLSPVTQLSECVASWPADVYDVKDIRMLVTKRWEHLTEAERHTLKARGTLIREIMSNPAKFKQHMEENEHDEQDEESDEDDDNNDSVDEVEQSQSSLSKQEESEASSTAPSNQRRRRRVVHRSSLPPPAVSNVSFDSYFHSHNQHAFRAEDMEHAFEQERERMDEESRGKGKITEESIVLGNEQPTEDQQQTNADTNSEDESDELHRDEQSHPLPSSIPSLPFSLSSFPYPHLGRPMVLETVRRVYSGRVWFARPDSFPLTLDTLVHIVRLIFGSHAPIIVEKFTQLVKRLPRGFPVRTHMPIIPTITLDAHIQQFTADHQAINANYGESNGDARRETLNTKPDDASSSAPSVEDERFAQLPSSSLPSSSPSPSLSPLPSPEFPASFFSIPPSYVEEEDSEEQKERNQRRYRRRWKTAQVEKQRKKSERDKEDDHEKR